MVGGTRPGVGRLARQGLGIVRNRFDCFLNGATGGSCGGGGVGFVEEEALPRAWYVKKYTVLNFLMCTYMSASLFFSLSLWQCRRI
jgi:hypothetical protein